MRCLFVLAFAVALLNPSSLFAGDPNGALAAMRALPALYQTGILELTADRAAPNPRTWHLVARNPRDRSVPVYFRVSQGQILSERPSLNVGRLFRAPSPIDLSRIRIDSTDAWNAAQRFVANRNQQLGSVSYRLEQMGSAAAPIWSVWCYDLSGRYIGFISLLATTGAVTSSR